VSERIIAIVPVRSLRDGKTRLSPVLGSVARAALLQRTAERVVTAARDSGVFDAVLVVSADRDVLDWAAGLGPGILAVPQPDQHLGLNGAIDAGREWAIAGGADAVLSLFADLPLLTPGDIRQLTAHGEPVVLGPDRRGEGTNALLLRLRGAGPQFRYAFGVGSLAKHREEARRLGLAAALHVSPAMGFDLDIPEDWTDFVEAGADLADVQSVVSAPCGASRR
jgi:2-phospho-L-lactate guanylyltransferase